MHFVSHGISTGLPKIIASHGEVIAAVKIGAFLLLVWVLSRMINEKLSPDIFYISITTSAIIAIALFGKFGSRYIPWLVILQIKYAVYISYINPLGTPDSKRYYVTLLREKWQHNSLTEMVGGMVDLRFAIIDAVSRAYMIVSYLYDSLDKYVLVYGNHMLILFSSILFVEMLQRKYETKNMERTIILWGISLSPIISIQSSFLLKEAFVVFTVTVFICGYQYYKEKKTVVSLILIVLTIVYGTLMRPYFAFIALAYIVALEDWKTSKTNVILLTATSFIIVIKLYTVKTGGIAATTEILKEIVLTYLAMIGSPNYFRMRNWIEYPAQTVEALFLSMVFLLSIMAFAFSRDNKNKMEIKKILIALLIYSMALGTVAYNNRIAHSNRIAATGSLVGEDIGRKKVPIVLLQYKLLLHVIFIYRRKKRFPGRYVHKASRKKYFTLSAD